MHDAFQPWAGEIANNGKGCPPRTVNAKRWLIIAAVARHTGLAGNVLNLRQSGLYKRRSVGSGRREARCGRARGNSEDYACSSYSPDHLLIVNRPYGGCKAELNHVHSLDTMRGPAGFSRLRPAILQNAG